MKKLTSKQFDSCYGYESRAVAQGGAAYYVVKKGWLKKEYGWRKEAGIPPPDDVKVGDVYIITRCPNCGEYSRVNISQLERKEGL